MNIQPARSPRAAAKISWTLQKTKTLACEPGRAQSGEGSAPTARLPVPPQRMLSAADMAVSPSASLTNWYLKLVPRLSKPAWSAAAWNVQMYPILAQRHAKILGDRLSEYSPEMSSSSAEGMSPFWKQAIIGNVNSSSTHGSSRLNVSGNLARPPGNQPMPTWRIRR